MRSCLLALFLVACGGDASPDAALDAPIVPDADPGPGSGTLKIEGRLIAENPSNISDGANFMVRCEVVVTLEDGTAVTNAIIQISPPGGFVTTLVADDLTPNVYENTFFSYSDTVRFKVSRGAPDNDFLAEMTLVGPDPFVVEMPLRGSLHAVTEDLHVVWGLPGGAETEADVELETGGFSMLGISDSGSIDIPAAELAVGEETVIVRRWHHNGISAGAVPGSFVDIAVESHQPIMLQ